MPAFFAAEKHFAAAIEEYSKAISLNPNSAIYYSNRAFAHIKLELYGAARTDATRAIEIDPKYVKVCQRAASLSVSGLMIGTFSQQDRFQSSHLKFANSLGLSAPFRHITGGQMQTSAWGSPSWLSKTSGWCVTHWNCLFCTRKFQCFSILDFN